MFCTSDETDKQLTYGFFHLSLIIIIPIVAIGLIAFFYLNKTKQGNSVPFLKVNPDSEKLNPTPTSYPFQELTIPYLRERKYESKLGTLEKFSENSDYTAYITSYDSDGLKIYGYLTIPKNSDSLEKFPAIVFVHGYIPPQNYRTTVNYNSYVDFLAKNGFVVFKIDLRGHGNSQGDASGAYYSGDYVIDTLNAYSALQNANFIDPQKIGLWGHSMAGNITFRSFVAKTDLPAIVIWAGAGYTYTDLQSYMIEDSSYQPPPSGSERARKRQLLRDTYGNFEPGHSFWKQVPATNYLNNVSGAIQINHAINDPVVSIDYSRNLMKILDGTNIVHQLKEYPDGGHNLTGSTFNQAMQNTVNFFQNHLK